MSSFEHDLLPRYVAVGQDERAGVIHRDMFGGWHANNWNGPLGTFVTAEEAEQAIRQAPSQPKKKKRLLQEPPDFALRFRGLTDPDAGFLILNKGKLLGGIVRTGGGYAAWGRTAKLGEFPTAAEAAAAVRETRR
ncbi:MAG TPA: hypothetical protein VKG91_09805 [Roseiarcus sp.]|nr:hypothetical protein [Roseiarcus sp.]